jgi:hypothetical protein
MLVQVMKQVTMLLQVMMQTTSDGGVCDIFIGYFKGGKHVLQNN